MSLKTNKRIVVAKIETTYGVDSTPTGAEAMLLRNLTVTPLDGDLANRVLIRPFFGNSDTLVASTRVKIDFEIEMAGAGAAGVIPAYGALLRACALSETAATQSVTSITRTGAVATLTKVAHGYVVGDIVKISGAVETEYNGNKTVATVPTADTLTYAVTGTPTTPATGTILAGTMVTYAPVSSSIESVSMYFNLDGIQQKILGARGNVSISVVAKQIPILKFSMMGLYAAPTDTAALTPTYTGFMQPQVANTDHTLVFSLFGYSGIMQSMEFNVANEVVHRELIGYEGVEIVDRKPAGTFLIELPTIAAKDFFSAANAGTTGALSLTHGSLRGNQVAITAPRISIAGPTYGDDNGAAMLSIPFTASPSTGNDDFAIIVK